MKKQNMAEKKENSFIGIREIAQIANVSTATVSRAINHPEKCSEKTREKIQKIIKEYNYVPNESIKHIFSKSSNTIAIFIQDITNPFYAYLITEINNLCFKERYTLFICNTENAIEKEKAYLELCLAKRCAGIILTEGTTNKLYKNIEIPLVALDRKESDGIPSVTSESNSSIRKVISYLHNLGHQKIAFVGPYNSFCSVKNRYKAYETSMNEMNIPIRPEYIFRENGRVDTKFGREALQYFLSLPEMPTALICANDLIALGVINEAKLLNIDVPEALSVCGYDHVLDNLLHIPLTTVEQNIPEIASELFSALIDPPERPTQKIIDSTFIPGQTCARAMTNENE